MKHEETGFDTRVLVVGCGSIGRRHARVLQQIGLSNLAVCDPAQGSRQAVQPMGNLFEQCLFLLGDTIIYSLMEKHQISPEEMFERHANLE